MTRSPAAIRSHRWHMTTLLCLALLGFFSHPIAAEASTRDIKEMADVCMYAQRILKDYALIGMGVTYHDPATDLKKNAKVVDSYVADIENHHLTGQSRLIHRKHLEQVALIPTGLGSLGFNAHLG